MIQRNERLSKCIRGEAQPPNGEVDTSLEESPSKTASAPGEDATSKKEEDKSDGASEDKKSTASALESLDEQVKDWNAQVVSENKNLHRLNTSLHEKNHFLSLKQAEFEERFNAEETKNEELQNKLDDLEYELTKYRLRNGKLETTLVDTQVCLNLKSCPI